MDNSRAHRCSIAKVHPLDVAAIQEFLVLPAKCTQSGRFLAPLGQLVHLAAPLNGAGSSRQGLEARRNGAALELAPALKIIAEPRSALGIGQGLGTERGQCTPYPLWQHLRLPPGGTSSL